MGQSRDFGTLALASAIHNTGQYHVRWDWSACLPSCGRIAKDRRNCGGSECSLDHLRDADSQRIDGTKAAGKSALGLHFPIFA